LKNFTLPVIVLLLSALSLETRAQAGFEPWATAPGSAIKPREQVKTARIPVLKLPAGYHHRQLPYMVDNSSSPYFPGILSQLYYFNCMQLAGISYGYAYEVNRLRNLSSAEPANRYPGSYTWTFLNGGGRLTGVSYLDSWEIMKTQGHPTMPYYPGDEEMQDVGWMSGYDNYYHGMMNRVKEVYSIALNTEEGIQTLKAYLYDHLEGSSSGGVAVFSASANFTELNMKTIPAGLPAAGLHVLTGFYPMATHGMTIVGYNDSIRFDLNGDGHFTNNTDINGDGVVDPKDWEVGAWIMANSYGTWWMNGGFCYILCSALAKDYDDGWSAWTPESGAWNQSAYVVVPDPDYTPLLTMKVSLDFTSRNKLSVSAGVSADTATHVPEHLMTFPIFNYQGASHVMQGFDTVPGGSHIEFGLDVTPLFSYVQPGIPVRFFLSLDEKDSAVNGQGQVEAVSFIRYVNGITEYSMSGSPVPIKKDDVTLISVIGAPDFSKVHVVTDALPGFSSVQPYEVQLQAAGGTEPYRWTLVRRFTQQVTDSVFPMIPGQALYPVNPGITWAKVALPFPFPFYGKMFDTVYMNQYGFVAFDASQDPCHFLRNEEQFLRSVRTIAPAFSLNYNYDDQVPRMWFEPSADRVTFRWNMVLKENPAVSSNFAMRLYPGGEIEFLYGDVTGGSFPFRTWSGFSSGDGINDDIWANWDVPGLAGKSFRYLPSLLPPGAAITSPGLLSLSAADSAAVYDIPVRVTDRNDVFDERTLKLSLSSVQNQPVTNDFSLWPNPAGGSVNLVFPGNLTGKVNVSVFDVTGRILCTKSIFLLPGENICRLDLQGLAKGVYVVKADGADYSRGGKLIVE
jgi:hypothetical protein